MWMTAFGYAIQIGRDGAFSTTSGVLVAAAIAKGARAMAHQVEADHGGEDNALVERFIKLPAVPCLAQCWC